MKELEHRATGRPVGVQKGYTFWLGFVAATAWDHPTAYRDPEGG